MGTAFLTLSLLVARACWAASPAKPSCRSWTPEMGWEVCDDYLSWDNLCCAGGYAFSALENVWTTHDGEGRFTNVTFNFTSQLLMDGPHVFVLDLAAACSTPSSCFVLKPPSFGRHIHVQVSMPGHGGAYEVLHTNQARYTRWAYDLDSAECKFLQTSAIAFDVLGSDLKLRVLPPLVPLGALGSLPNSTISSACVYLYSARTNLSFTCTEGIKPRGDVERVFCLHRPFEDDGVLLIPNATHFYNGKHGLRFHCARIHMGALGCDLFSNDVFVVDPSILQPLATPLIPGYVIYVLWGLAAAVSVCLLFLLRRLCLLARARPDVAATLPLGPLIERQAYKGVFLYCHETNEHLTDVVRLITKIIKWDDQAQVLDPYADKKQLLETGAPRYAQEILSDPSNHFIFLVTERALTVLAKPANNVFDNFYASAISFIEANPGSFGADRAVTLTLRAGISVPLPLRGRVLNLPDHLHVLLDHIPIFLTEERRGRITRQECCLSKLISEYNKSA